MKKISVKVLSIILCVATIFSCLPFSVFAQEENTLTPQQNEMQIAATNDIGEIFQNSIEQVSGGNTGNAFSSVSLSGKTASVQFQSTEDCTLVVAVMSEENGQVLGTGISQVTANTFLADVDIDIDSLPKYFILRAFLLDENMAPLCQPFTNIEYTKMFEEFKAKDVYDFPDNEIINFDSDTEDNFAVLVDGAVEAATGTKKNNLVSRDEKSNTFVFENIDNSIKGLSSGDILYIETADEIILIKVKKITIKNNTATIVEDVDADYEDFFKYIDVDQQSNPNGEDRTVDMSNADEGIEYAGSAPWSEDIQTQEWIDDDFSATRAEVFKFPDKYLVGNEDSVGSVKLSGEIKAAVTFSLKVYFDSDWSWDWRWDFWNSLKIENTFFFESKFEFSITGSVEISGAIQTDITIASINFVTPVGIVCGIDFKLHLEVSAAIKFQLKAISMTIGFKYQLDSGFENLSSGPSINIYPEVNGEATVKIGIVVAPDISLVKVVGIELAPEFGAKATVTLFDVKVEELLKPNTIEKIHACENTCLDGVIEGYAECSISGEIFGKAFASFDLVEEYTLKITDFYIRTKPSFSFNIGDCPNNAYKVEYHVIGKDNKNVANVTVNSGGPDLKDRYPKNVTNTTNSDGLVWFFYPKGKYTASFLVDGDVKATQKVDMVASTKKFTIKIDVDGTTDPENPDTPITPPTSGVSWKFDAPTSTLTIYGKGAMDDYSSFGSAPWDAYRDSIKKIVVEEGVTSIGNYAFAQCMKAQTVSLPSTLTKIGMASFYQCDALQSVTLPANVTSVGDYAFYGCYSMTKLGLGSVKTLGMYSFAQCTGLTNVNVPSTTTSVGESAFGWCQLLKSISFGNKNCTIYDSANTIYSSATIYGASGSTAQKYANKYGRSFVTLQTASVVDTTESYDSLAFTFNGCVPGNEYILLNVTGYGAGFVLSTSNLEYINQFTADNTGKVSHSFIPRNIVTGSTTLLIGDFGNGAEAKEITTTVQSTAVSIDNNPGTKKINYREGIRLTATATSPIDGATVAWYVDGEYYSSGEEFVCKGLEHSIEVTVKLVDANGNPITVNGKELVDKETIKVDDSFFKRLSAFFKFTLFGQEVIKTN